MDDLAASSLSPLPGGESGETFLAEAAGERTVVRIYARPSHRGHRAHEVDAALLSLVRGLLPVPEVLEVRRADAAAGMPALLVTSLLPGVRGDLLLPELGSEGQRTLGRHVGALAADLAGMPLLRPGPFVDAELTIGGWNPEHGDGLPGWVASHAESLVGWHSEELAGLDQVAVRAQTLLDTVDRTCLVHGDLNPKNLLVDPGTLEVTGVVDWEFAHAGHCFTDLGNLLRFDREPSYVEGVLTAYTARHGVVVDRALDLARAADLFALVELAARPERTPVAERAERLLRAIARARDTHAEPDR